MDDIILYPTETVYGLGVNALSEAALETLFKRKSRDIQKTVSWLVRNIDDVARYAEVSPKALAIIEQFLPGPMTIVLPVKDSVPDYAASHDRTVGFRISSDKSASALIEEFMKEHNAPLTCTSANVSGLATLTTPESIVNQFKACDKKFVGFSRVIDDGPRSGLPSTVVKIVNDELLLLREGVIPLSQFRLFL